VNTNKTIGRAAVKKVVLGTFGVTLEDVRRYARRERLDLGTSYGWRAVARRFLTVDEMETAGIPFNETDIDP